MNNRHRANLLRLAIYLESLPRNYKHFDMRSFADHRGECELPMQEDKFAAKDPLAFLSNCGTVACAVGHGPAAGLSPVRSEFRPVERYWSRTEFAWDAYAARVFGIDNGSCEFDYLFGSGWSGFDNHPYGAAARIRHYLANGLPPAEDDVEWGGKLDRGEPSSTLVKTYAPYRKGSRSAKRREIDAVAA